MNNLNITTGFDHFSATTHPEVAREIKSMAQHVTDVAGTFKRDILISFIKDHSIKVDWLVDNEVFVEMITSGSLKIHHTERLFGAERSNKPFVVDLEGYIETELLNGVSGSMHRNVLSAISSTESVGQRYYACTRHPV